MSVRRAALYAHIPFCARKCEYCDFESHALSPALARAYIERVLTEARAARDEYGGLCVPSLYIGGGTPSFIPAEDIALLIGGLGALFDIRADAEITIEANPGTLDPRKLDVYRAAGVNRVSLGAQAYQRALLKTLGRIHDWDMVARAVNLARAAGIENISLDLMYALPNQTLDDWRNTLSAAIALDVNHISCYSLILERSTPLFARVEAGEISVCGEDMALDMTRIALDALARAGYARYEISNFARAGFECAHNIVYWTRGEYLGLGSAAHSLMDGARFYNPPYAEYMRGDARLAPERLSARECMEETIMLETRLARGLDIDNFRVQFGDNEADNLIKRARPLENGGLLRVIDDFIALTPRGMDVHNAVVIELLPA